MVKVKNGFLSVCVIEIERYIIYYSQKIINISIVIIPFLNWITLSKAKEMVELSRSIANKIKDKQGDITEDEVRNWTV